MSGWTAALLGVVQGLTEFLPISSSAHLLLARAVIGWDAAAAGLAFDVACHAGTLAAVVVYFRRDLAAMAVAVVAPRSPDRDAWLRQVGLLAVASVPIGVVGLTLDDVIETSLRTPAVAAVALAAGGLVFIAVERRPSPAGDVRSLTAIGAIWIGVAQALALVPGVSRSGGTIVAGLLVGLRREEAARFGFLLGIPAIAAAAVRQLAVMAEGTPTAELWWLLAVGAVSSGVVGYAAVASLLRYLAGHTLTAFAVYRLVLAGVAAVWLLGA